jgi:hypothetical protein
MVGVGIPGGLVFFTMLGAVLARAVRWYVVCGTAVSAAWGTIVVISIVAGLADNVMFTPHNAHHLFLVMVYVFAARALGQWPPRRGAA